MASDEKNRPIPIVDIGQLGLGHEEDPSEDELQRVAKEIADAFKDIGFVYLTRHGIPEEHIERLVETGATFFDLPQHEKDRVTRNPETNDGYVAVNKEKFTQKYSYELREAYDITNVDGMYPDDTVPDFRQASVEFIDSCKKLTVRLLTVMAMGLGLDRNFFVDTHRNMLTGNSETTLRLLHYPPVPPDVKSDTIRCGAHTDYGTVTLLFQDDMGGLYVRDRDDNWISADPTPGTILVNVGELLQFWTSDIFIATEHQVLIPEEETRQRKSRRSVAFFVVPDDAVIIKPLNGSPDYKPITAKEHILKRYGETFED